MGNIQGNSRVSGASVAEPDETIVNDCADPFQFDVLGGPAPGFESAMCTKPDNFGETDVLNLDVPDAEGDYTQRLRIRIDMANKYWRLAVYVYVAFILVALLHV